MDKETLSNYGWIVICVLVLAVMIALATPFGSFIAGAVENTTEGLFGASQKAMSIAGLEVPNQTMEDAPTVDGATNGGGVATPDTNTPAEPAINYVHEGTIPEGGIYYIQTNQEEYHFEELTAGDAFPVPTVGDRYSYNGYSYRYGTIEKGAEPFPTYTKEFDGWNVMHGPNVAEPDPALTSIAGEAVIYMDRTFVSCSALVKAPKIQEGIVNIAGAYYDCKQLVSVPELPNSIVDMTETFYGCTSLESAPAIPANVKELQATFMMCSNLKKTPFIPEGVTDIHYAFNYCENLETITNLPDSIQSMESAFEECAALKHCPDLPASLVNATYAFGWCINLENLPAVPNTCETEIGEIFIGCTKIGFN